jgi:opacity protein-like surface antigen
MDARFPLRLFLVCAIALAGLLVGPLSSPARAGGLVVNGSDADVKEFKDTLEWCKKKSKTFKQLMEGGLFPPGYENPLPGIDTPKSNVTITVNVSRTGDFLDDASGGMNTVNVNLDNLAKLPDPDVDGTGHLTGFPPGYEKWGMTRCEDIAHFLGEAVKNSTHSFDVTAHQFGVWVQNEVRDNWHLKSIPVRTQDNYRPGETSDAKHDYVSLTYLKDDPLAPTGDISYLGISHGATNFQVIWFHDHKMYTWFYKISTGDKPTGKITEMTAPAPKTPSPTPTGGTTPGGTTPGGTTPGGTTTGGTTPGTTPAPTPTPPPKDAKSTTPSLRDEHSSVPWIGGYGSLYGVLGLSDVTTTERFADTGMVTATLHDCCSGAGGGIRGGYNFPVSGNVLLGPVFDIYAPNDVVNHQFAAGGNIRSTVNFTFTAKARASYIANPSLVFYAQTGFGLANQQLSLNFGTTPTSSHGDWTPGFVLGGGVEWLLSDGRSGLFGLPTSLFIDYDHAWWANAHFNTPAASPLFNYAWSRESNVFKAGVTIHFAAPQPN